MEYLQSVIRAAHCRSTHHLFAIDALRHVRSDRGRLLARLLLRYHSRYLQGACDPDVRFRDFQNHVVHVSDGNWGGAPQSAQRWYERVQKMLQAQRWSDAAHAAGVLSHYFTDPLQPLHTACSDRESVVHGPLEWSIYRSYDAIMARWRDDAFRIVFRLSTRSDWLASAVIRGAELAHQSFETLVETYDLESGRHDPQKGLSDASLEALAELCGVAITGWARVLDRTAEEADGALPHFSLTWSAVLASLKMPYGWFLRRGQSKCQLAQIREAMAYYHRTGEIGPHAPDDVRLIRKVIAVRDRERQFAENFAQRRQAEKEENATRLWVVSPHLEAEPAPTEPARPVSGESCGGRSVTPASPIAEAASIGPRTAARLRTLEVVTVHQLLAAAPEELIRRLQERWPTQTHWIDVETVAGWQAQTRLRMALPQMRARDARMLVAVGYRSIGALAAADVRQVRDKLVRHGQTPEGRLALRGKSLPSQEELQSWIQAAASEARAAG